MNPGQLDRRVILQKSTSVEVSKGEYSDTWVNVGTVWAKRQAQGAWSIIRAEQEATKIKEVYTIRYRPNVVPGMRVVEGKEIFDIVAAPDKEGTKRWLELVCEAFETEGEDG